MSTPAGRDSALGWPAEESRPAETGGTPSRLGWPEVSRETTLPAEAADPPQEDARESADSSSDVSATGVVSRETSGPDAVGPSEQPTGPPATPQPASPPEPDAEGADDDESQRRIRRLLHDVDAAESAPGPPAGQPRPAPRTGPASRFPRPPDRRTVCVANQKGGVGKTTSTVNVAVALAQHGGRVLVVDLDPQGNASTGLGIDHHPGVPSIYDTLVHGSPLTEVSVPVQGIEGLSCVPATIDLAGAEIELVPMVARETRLRRALGAYDGEVDYILIDCPPSLGLLTVNALAAAEEVLIPIQCEYYALEGLGQLMHTIDMVRSHLNERVRVSTILLTMYDARTRLADQVAAEVREHFGDVVLDTLVPRSVRVSEAPGYGQSVMTYDPGSRGAQSYLAAAREIAERGSAADSAGKSAGKSAGQSAEKEVQARS